MLFDADGEPLNFFSVELSILQMNQLGADKSSTVMFEAELCAVVLAFVLYKQILFSRPVVCYVDNNGTRDVLISGAARNRVGARLAKLFLTIEDLARVFAWFTRVPSPSNVADEPSRVCMAELTYEGKAMTATSVGDALCEILSVADACKNG